MQAQDGCVTQFSADVIRTSTGQQQSVWLPRPGGFSAFVTLSNQTSHDRILLETKKAPTTECRSQGEVSVTRQMGEFRQLQAGRTLMLP